MQHLLIYLLIGLVYSLVLHTKISNLGIDKFLKRAGLIIKESELIVVTAILLIIVVIFWLPMAIFYGYNYIQSRWW